MTHTLLAPMLLSDLAHAGCLSRNTRPERWSGKVATNS